MSAATSPGQSPSSVDELQLEADAFFSASGLAGLAVTCVGDSTAVALSGLANRETQRPVSLTTAFRVGSITKTFVALAAIRLVEDGRLDVDAPVNDYLRMFTTEWPENPALQVTTRQLLTHTAGFDPGLEGITLDWEAAVPSPSEIYGPVVHPKWAPGSARRYSNHGYVVMGQVVEDVLEIPLAEALCRMVFEPLGMTHTTLTDPAEHAQGYGTDGTIFRPASKRTLLPAAGAAWSTANDMSLYLAALLNGGSNQSGRVVSAESLEAMLTEQVPGPDLVMGTDDSQGYGFKIVTSGGRRLVRHAGSFAGFCAAMYFDRDALRGAAVLTNTRGRGFEVFRDIDKFAARLVMD